jgi:hypothetical protein
MLVTGLIASKTIGIGEAYFFSLHFNFFGKFRDQMARIVAENQAVESASIPADYFSNVRERGP